MKAQLNNSMVSVKYFQGEIKELVQSLRDLSFPWAWGCKSINWKISAAFLWRHRWEAVTHCSEPHHNAAFSDGRYCPCRKTCLGKGMWTLPELQSSVVTSCISSSLPLWIDSGSERPTGPMPFQSKSVRRRIVNKQYTELWTRTTLRSMNHVLQVKTKNCFE